MQDQSPSQATPSGLQALSLLAGRRRLTPSIIESVRTILAERGQLWAVKGDQAQRGRFGQLCLEADFDQALGPLLEPVRVAFGQLAKTASLPPGATEALAQYLVERGELFTIDGAPMAHGLTAGHAGFTDPPLFWAALESLCARNADFASTVADHRALVASNERMGRYLNAPRPRR